MAISVSASPVVSQIDSSFGYFLFDLISFSFFKFFWVSTIDFVGLPKTISNQKDGRSAKSGGTDWIRAMRNYSLSFRRTRPQCHCVSGSQVALINRDKRGRNG
jgi:hypothetical protein